VLHPSLRSPGTVRPQLEVPFPPDGAGNHQRPVGDDGGCGHGTPRVLGDRLLVCAHCLRGISGKRFWLARSLNSCTRLSSAPCSTKGSGLFCGSRSEARSRVCSRRTYRPSSSNPISSLMAEGRHRDAKWDHRHSLLCFRLRINWNLFLCFVVTVYS
jgi:hypothetical protein